MLPITPIVRHLLIINVIVFLGIMALPTEWARMMAFCSPSTGYFQPFQIITYMFTHYGLNPWMPNPTFDITHLLFNMLGLFFLGPMVEMFIGSKRFLGLYFISGFVALLAHLVVYYLPYMLGMQTDPPIFIVNGASGAVYGVIIAFATFFPDRQLMLLFPPIPIRAWVMAVILVGIGLYQGLTGKDIMGGDMNVANFAHLGGALAGFLLARHWKRGGRFLG